MGTEIYNPNANSNRELSDGYAPTMQHVTAYDPAHGRKPESVDDGPLNFWDMLKVVTRRKWMILSIIVMGLILASFMVMRATPLYQSSATIEIQRTDSQIIQGGGVEPVSVADKEFMVTQLSLIESRSLAERVVTALDLSSDPNYANQSASRPAKIRQATSRVLRNMTVTPVGRSRVIRVRFVSPDPKEAARVPNAIVENFIESALERKYNLTSYARDFLTERLSVAKTSLEEAERRLVDYAKEEDILELSGDSSGSLDESAILVLSEELAKAQGERIQREEQYQQMLRNPEQFALRNGEEVQDLRERRGVLQDEYSNLGRTYKPSFPAMLDIQAKIDSIDAQIQDIRDYNQTIALNEAKSAFEVARSREASLRARVSGLSGNLQNLRERRVNYTILKREVDTARSQYDALLQRLKEVSISSGVGSSQISIIDKAVEPRFAFKPNRRRSLIQAFLLSLILGVGLAFGLHFIDDTITTPDDVKTKLGLPALGVVPKVKAIDNLISEALKDPKSDIAEAYHSARTALEFTTGSGAPKSLAVTSTVPGEGKTSTAAALSTAFAKVGKKVLIIDADMRKPSFVADAELSVGLSGMLTHDYDLSENIVKSATTDGLYLLPSGVIPPNPAELLSGSRLQKLVREAETMFDIVIIDCPPVLSFADSPILGSVAEGTLVVMRSGKVRTQAAERTLSRLRDSRSKVLGIILMQFDAKRAGYNYGYYYYAYGKGAENYKTKTNEKSSSSVHRKIRMFTEDDVS